MRKIALACSVVTATALATPVWAQQPYGAPPDPAGPTVAAGAVAGTVVGLGFSEGWWASPAALNTVAGAAAVGLVAGIGTTVLIHSVTTPCRGFRIFVDAPEACGAMLRGEPAPGLAPRRRVR